MNETAHHRTVRSFVRREGRMTAAQQRALRELWQAYGVDADGVLDLQVLFGRRAPCIVEIGFGMGDTLVELATRHPENNYLGIEVYRPGIGSLLQKIRRRNLENIRIVAGDALEVVRGSLADESLDAIYLFFPDPWPKKRHHKRRIVQADSVALLAGKLKPGGILHLATDWEDYATHMLDAVATVPGLINQTGPGRFAERPEYRPRTKFEQRGQRLGHHVRDLIFIKNGP